MKPSVSSVSRLLAAVAFAGLFAALGPARAADTPDGKAMLSTDGDTIIVLASDTLFGPDMSDSDVAVRYYCSTRGKLSVFVSKERPPEMKDSILRAWSVMTYHCVTPETK